MENRTLKIAIIQNSASSVVNFRNWLIKDLVNHKLKVFALAPDYNHGNLKKVEQLGAIPIKYNLTRASIDPFKEIIDLLKLVLTLRCIKPGIAISYTTKPVIYGTIASWLSGVRKRYAVIEGLGYAFTNEPGKNSIKKNFLRTTIKLLYRIALKIATKVFFLNEDDLNEFICEGIVNTQKAFLLGPIGVDLKFFYPAPPILNPITFIFIGRLLKEKGVREYAEAARLIKTKYPNVRFIIVGGLDAHPGAITIEEIEKWVKEGIVEWPGEVQDVRPYLSQSSVLVLPSYYREGFPRTIQEAMAMARPIITTDAPGCREAVKPGVNGYLVPARDVEALALAMEKFIETPNLIARMGIESRKIAEERFDVHKINQTFLHAIGIIENAK
jgi:glycosyltransferase involved in cell wall biosynthesis